MLVSLAATKLSAQVVTQEADAYNNLDSLVADDTDLTADLSLTASDSGADLTLDEEDVDLGDADADLDDSADAAPSANLK